MVRTYKRKLILNTSQEERLRAWIGVCRLVYNMALEIKQATYNAKGVSIRQYALQKQLPELRKSYDWVKDVPNDCLQNSIERLDRSYDLFFKTHKNGGGRPRFISKKKYKSITFRRYISLDGNNIKINKIGWLKIFKDSPIEGEIKTAIIKIEPTGFFISIVSEAPDKNPYSENQAVGLDLGISHFCVDSNGNFIANPKHFKKYERKLRVENRSLCRKETGSNSWNKQAKKVGLLHHKIANIRKDYLHKESTKIARRYSDVYMENLNIKGMAKNGNLSKHILDCGWGMFKEMLSYKTNVVLVDAHGTSQTCNACGHKDKASRKSQSLFSCTSCGHEDNADINAAKNIKSRGTTLSR